MLTKYTENWLLLHFCTDTISSYCRWTWNQRFPSKTEISWPDIRPLFTCWIIIFLPYSLHCTLIWKLNITSAPLVSSYCFSPPSHFLTRSFKLHQIRWYDVLSLNCSLHCLDCFCCWYFYWSTPSSLLYVTVRGVRSTPTQYSSKSMSTWLKILHYKLRYRLKFVEVMLN